MKIGDTCEPESKRSNDDHDKHLAAPPMLLIIHRGTESEEWNEEKQSPVRQWLQVPVPSRATVTSLDGIGGNE